MNVSNIFLEKWEKELDKINEECFVPIELLKKSFNDENMKYFLNNKLKNSENISYHTAKSPISLRYINDAYVWSSVLKYIDFNKNNITELCPGTSVVFDLTLSYIDYEGYLIKVDYTKWEDKSQQVLRKYQVKSIDLDVIKETNKIPQTDLLIVNHGIDDLFVGLWAEDNNVDYFGYAINKIDENNKCWNQAIENNNKYVDILKKFVKQIANKINIGGHIIFKNYASGFETNYRQIERIDFTYKLTKMLVDEILKNNFKQIDINLDEIDGPKGSKYDDAFFVLERI